MHAVGEPHESKLSTTLDMLSIFATSMEKYKASPGAPNQQDLGLLRNVHFVSPVKTA